MNFGIVKVLVGYLTASAAALLASVQLACVLGGQTVIAFSGNFFR
jgi:hypothetical protein